MRRFTGVARLVEMLVSGGQTGVDRAALDVALALGIACGGWCPRGRRAEDAPLPRRYPLNETPSADYAQRTGWNVRDSDATLLLTPLPPDGGTALTLELAERMGRPHLAVDLHDLARAREVRAWLASELGSEEQLGQVRDQVDFLIVMAGTEAKGRATFLQTLRDGLVAIDASTNGGAGTVNA